jgi:hypothetical protein
MSDTFIDGDTSERTVTLTEDGQPMDLTDATVTLMLRNNKRALATITSGIRVMDPPTAGKIGYKPDPANLPIPGGPYTARWRIVTADDVRLCPFPEAAQWSVLI